MSRAVSSIGQSAKHQQQRKNVLRIYNLFAAQPDCPQAFKPFTQFYELPEGLMCSRALYAEFAGFLLDVYRIDQGPNKGQPLRCGSILDYMGIILNLAANEHKAT
eukprot:3558579-Pyramimonas_sp.AAC.1